MKLSLRLFSKILYTSTVFLIFAGGMVTSTGSGLAVPDWPLSYGTLFPPMVGGVFYEHGHRMIAGFVAILMLACAIWLYLKEKRRWAKVLGYCALTVVIVQALLGGLTVLLMLPTCVSVFHATLAQTFLVITLMIAYSQSRERFDREKQKEASNKIFIITNFILFACTYLQLIMGAVMRHTHSGLAVYDFPTMAGSWWPSMNDAMLLKINVWRFDHDLTPVTFSQVGYHLLHRAGAIVISLALCILNIQALKYYKLNTRVMKTVIMLDVLLVLQIILGVTSVLLLKPAFITSLHVVNGALILSMVFLLLLRAAPLTITQNRRLIYGF